MARGDKEGRGGRGGRNRREGLQNPHAQDLVIQDHQPQDPPTPQDPPQPQDPSRSRE